MFEALEGSLLYAEKSRGNSLLRRKLLEFARYREQIGQFPLRPVVIFNILILILTFIFIYICMYACMHVCTYI
jgi:hypothetical protein